jgi:hypothetical protein
MTGIGVGGIGEVAKAAHIRPESPIRRATIVTIGEASESACSCAKGERGAARFARKTAEDTPHEHRQRLG